MYRFVRLGLYYNTKNGKLHKISEQKRNRMELRGEVFDDTPFSFGNSLEAKLKLLYGVDSCIDNGILYRFRYNSNKTMALVLSDFCHTVGDYCFMIEQDCSITFILDDTIKRVSSLAFYPLFYRDIRFDTSRVTSKRLRKQFF